jgi:hypothetical protein
MHAFARCRSIVSDHPTQIRGAGHIFVMTTKTKPRSSIRPITFGLAALVLLFSTACIDDAYEDELAFCEEFPEDCDEVERAASITPGSVGNGIYFPHTFNKVANYRYTVCINVTSGDADLYGSYLPNPTNQTYQYKSDNGGEKDDCISFDSTSNGPYYVRVHGWAEGISNYVYRVTSSPKTSIPAYLNESLNWPVDTCKTLTSAKYGPFNSPWGNANTVANPFFPGHQNYLHNGTDIACPAGRAVLAACTGPIKRVGNLGDDVVNGVTYYYGAYVQQECVVNGTTVTIVYDHLNFNNLPAVNAVRNTLDPIGTVYDIAYPGEVDHLHFGICKGNNATCYVAGDGTFKAIAGAMPDTLFSGVMVDPYNAAIYNDVVTF